MSKKKYVIIGNSAAAIGAVEGIRQVDKQGEIAIITDEPHHTYSRPLISYLLQGKVTRDSMKYRPDGFYTDNNCEIIHGTANKIEPQMKQVILKNGERVTYEKLLVATGSRAFIPPVFEKLDNKYSFMTIDDAVKLDKAISEDSRILIIGAGLIGLKCAEGILERVKSVTVADIAPRILSAVLEEESAVIIQTHLESKGVQFRLSSEITDFENYDVVVIAAGVRPNVELLQGVAEIGRGVVVNEKSETSATDIFAAGDCTETVDITTGERKIMALLPNAYMQGEAAGINMSSCEKIKVFDKAIPMNAAGFFGLHVITAGSYSGEVYIKKTDETYKKLFYSDNKLNGFILIGNVDKAGIYTSLIREKTPLDSIDFELVCERPGLMAFAKEERLIKLGEAK
ncbi:MAG: FAD-dependent oxidoreductase [Oscillospiraceae bacterium]|nr:FAD-dependent oxidoreductase [Oscillospiraceae bacterium]